MRLTQISVRNFPPLEDGTIRFPAEERASGLAEVHLLTGENGAGKTRILAALIAALGNEEHLHQRVREDSKAEIEVDAQSTWWSQHNPETPLRWAFRDGFTDPRFPNFAQRLRWLLAFSGSGVVLKADRAASGSAGGAQADVLEDSPPISRSYRPATLMDRLSLGGNPSPGILGRLHHLRVRVALERESNPKAHGPLASALAKLEACVTEITGRPFEFTVRSGREIRLMARFGGIEMHLSELPDGLRSLLNWLAAWTVLMIEHHENSPDPLSEGAILVLDEPENHLHPAWQRRVLRSVQRLFCGTQMFVVTHSPFVVSSLNHGWIHRFQFQESGSVRTLQPLPASAGDSYMTAVREVLGLQEWFDPDTESELAEFGDLIKKAADGDAEAGRMIHAKAASLTGRSREVTNLVGSLLAQLQGTGVLPKRPQLSTQSKSAAGKTRRNGRN
jgi:energy-coupling factor transporter ATP-binding protein EcfA2